MKNLILSMIFLGLIGSLTSCGAAKNNKSRAGSANEDSPRNTNNNAPSNSIEPQKLQNSHMYRNKDAQQFNYHEESLKITDNSLPKTHRVIPDPDRDIDSNVLRPEKIASPELDCGNYSGTDDQAIVSILARHKNCLAIQEDQNAVLWNGKNNAIMGEGKWQLIANSAYQENDVVINKLVWQDLSTGLLWSDLTPKLSWEEAVGVKNKDTRPCLSKSESPKYELGRIHPSIVSWRIPNRNEFLQADINGSRFVLPNTDQLTWTSSYAGTFDGIDKAWAIEVATGQLHLVETSTLLPTRCIGVVIK